MREGEAARDQQIAEVISQWAAADNDNDEMHFVGLNRQEMDMDQQTFKACPGCGVTLSLAQILEAQDVEPVGMQFIDPELKDNMYYFNHMCPNCGSTFLISVIEFLPFIKEPIPESVLTGTEVCGGNCTRLKDLEECHNPCLYAPFRRFLLSLQKARATESAVSPEATASTSH